MEVTRADFDSLRAEVMKIGIDLNARVGKLFDIITGDDVWMDGGMVGRIKHTTKEIARLEEELDDFTRKQVKYNVYTTVMWICVGAVGMAILALIFQNVHFTAPGK